MCVVFSFSFFFSFFRRFWNICYRGGSGTPSTDLREQLHGWSCNLFQIREMLLRGLEEMWRRKGFHTCLFFCFLTLLKSASIQTEVRPGEAGLQVESCNKEMDVIFHFSFFIFFYFLISMITFECDHDRR